MLKIAWHECYAHPLPEGHRFPMIKYDLLPQQLLYEGTIENRNIFEPCALKVSDILRVHSPTYWDKLKNGSLEKSEERRIGFPYSDSLVSRERVINQGTIDCANYALVNGVAMNIAGGTHHAYSDRGEGFCLLNDQAIAAQYLLDEKKASRILIVDLDVHQGNGTAEIFKFSDAVFTLSIHGQSNYPLKKEQSDLDIGLPDGTLDKTYLKELDKALSWVFQKFRPDFVFYQSGVDVLETDKLGRLSLSLEGCKQRDRIVFEVVRNYEIPLVICMGGGYSHNIKDIIEAHANTFRLAQDIFF